MDKTDATNDPYLAKRQLLEWQISMGADEAVDNDAADWFARSAVAKADKKAEAEKNSQVGQTGQNLPRPTLSRPTAKPPSAAQPVTASQDTTGDARKLAATCNSIDDLIAALASFDACPLSRTASNLCFVDGNRNAKILMIGEAPGRDEDIQGKPFVGRSGQLLDKMIGHIGLSRDNEDPRQSVLISNTVFWRPPGNRKPTESETLMCLPFVNKLIELVAPEIIVCLGATPTQRLTGQTTGITRLRGRWFDYSGIDNPIPVLATLHPSYLLLQPMQKKLAWRDLLALQLRISTTP